MFRTDRLIRICSSLILVFVLFVSVKAQTEEPHITEPFFDDFDSTLNTSVWQVAGWSEHGGQTGVERCFTSDGFLNMQFINDTASGTYLSSAMQSRDEFLYGKWEVRAKPSSVPGILNSIYTIDWNNTADNSSNSNGTHQEIDIEFLTKSFGENSGEVHFAVHASGKTSFNLNPDKELDFNPSDDFHIWGFDISPEKIEWFVDDQVLHTYIYDENEISITAPYQLKLNVWSAVNWIGGPPEPDVVCTYLIDWIKFTPMTTTDVSESKKAGLLKLENFPAPVINKTTVRYYIPFRTNVTISLYNSIGQLIKKTDKGFNVPGIYTYELDMESLPSGIYFYHFKTDYEIKTMKLLKVK